MRSILLFLLLSFNLQTLAQEVIGHYRDEITDIRLNRDSTFRVDAIDPVYPYTYKRFSSDGRWAVSGRFIILNPDQAKRRPAVSLVEAVVPGDSIHIRINYESQVYDHEQILAIDHQVPEMMTVYLNKRRNYRHLVKAPIRRVCGFSPGIKHQYVLDSTQTLSMKKTVVKTIGFRTYGFDREVTFIPTDPQANFFEIRVVQPVDADRVPRSRQILIKGNKLFYYDFKGELLTSGWLANPLVRVKE